jgi:hypothetical protein
MAYAMGYMISPLTGLRKFRFHHGDFCNELPTQDTITEKYHFTFKIFPLPSERL